MLLLLAGFWAVAGCERNSAPPAPPKRTSASAPAIASPPAAEYAPGSPADAVSRVHACRVDGRYQDMEKLLTPEHRHAVVDLVLAVDELISAELNLHRQVVEQLGAGSATRFNQRDQVANILGPFSRDVKIVGETVSDATAEVTIQVASRVPLETVALIRDGDTWLVKTDEPIPGLSQEIRNLAKTTAQVAKKLQGQKMSLDEIEKELALRQTSILKRMAKLEGEGKGEGEGEGKRGED